MQVTLNTETVEEVVANITDVVTRLEENDERSIGNLVVLVDVFDQVRNLVSSGQLNVTGDVRMNACRIVTH